MFSLKNFLKSIVIFISIIYFVGEGSVFGLDILTQDECEYNSDSLDCTVRILPILKQGDWCNIYDQKNNICDSTKNKYCKIIGREDMLFSINDDEDKREIRVLITEWNDGDIINCGPCATDGDVITTIIYSGIVPVGSASYITNHITDENFSIQRFTNPSGIYSLYNQTFRDEFVSHFITNPRDINGNKACIRLLDMTDDNCRNTEDNYKRGNLDNQIVNATACYKRGQLNYNFLGLDPIEAYSVDRYDEYCKFGVDFVSGTGYSYDNFTFFCDPRSESTYNRNYRLGIDDRDKCRVGDFLIPAKNNNNIVLKDAKVPVFCGNSFNLRNLNTGAHCFANYGMLNEPAMCGLQTPISVEGATCDDNLIPQVRMCHPDSNFNECVEIDYSTGYKDNRPQMNLTGYDEVANELNLERYLPDTGICMNCAGEDGELTEAGDECIMIDNDNANDAMVFDNCCSPTLYCNSENKCEEIPMFKLCNDLELPDVDSGEYIKPGEVCDYAYDNVSGDVKNYCDRCSVVGNPTIDRDSGNKVCPRIEMDPIDNIYLSQCRSDCGCIGSDRCLTSENRCVPEDSCAEEDEDNPDNLECCDKDLTKDSEDVCRLDCSAHIPGTKCIDRCCDDGICTDPAGNCADSLCKTRGAGECCGFNLKCDSTLNCVTATAGDPCYRALNQRPPRTGPARPEEMFTLEELLQSIVGILYPLAIIMGMGFIIFGGYQLTTSTGDPERVKKARQTLTSAIVGLIFVIMSATILRFVVSTIIGI